MIERIREAGIPGLHLEHLRRDEPFEMNVMHAHPNWELYYLLAGECTYLMDGRSYALQRGAFVFVPAGTLHRTSASRHERILIELDATLLPEAGVQLTLGERSLALQLNDAEQRQVEAFLRCIGDCLADAGEGHGARARLYLLSLLCFIDDHAHSAPAVPREHALRYRQAEAVIRYLEANYASDVTLDGVSQAQFISRYHLSRAFREATGCTVMGYLTEVRLQHARELLATTVLPVSEVAGLAGFNSLSHFNRVFAAHMGIPPLRYRRAMTAR